MSRPNRIKAQAALAGESLGAVADAVAVSRAVLYNVARGAAEPWPKLQQDLAEHFGVPVAHLFPVQRVTDRIES